MVEVLLKSKTGIIIENKKYNVFCYADDILLSSTTISGLQTLIDVSVNFIENHGLRFNPIKTSCFIRGKHPFCSNMKWYINAEELVLKENVNYLGAILCNHAGNNHVAARRSICRKTFYFLQNAGLCFKGLQTDTKLHTVERLLKVTPLRRPEPQMQPVTASPKGDLNTGVLLYFFKYL